MNAPDAQAGAIGIAENPRARIEYELQQVVDPKTKRIPEGIRQKELRFSTRHLSRNALLNSRGEGTEESTWQFSGPAKVGGRTRAIAYDANVGSGNTIIAGGVSGGIWKTDNGGSSWRRTSDPEIINSVTALVQDTRFGKEDTWYFGTGELLGNSARSGPAPYRGDGIFKSVDGGESWFQLESTKNADPTEFGSQFQYIWRMVTDHTDQTNDVLLVAAYGGILRSVDGGLTWSVVLGEDLTNLPEGSNLNEAIAPFYTDIAKTANGEFYAHLSSYMTLNGNYNKAGVYWSNDGINWKYLFSIRSRLFNIGSSRVVMDVDENGGYFFVSIGDIPLLYKFDSEGIDELSPSGFLQDLTSNLPDFDGFGALNIQDGYNMMVAMHPTDPDLVILGGTNLYRSTDGFTTKDNITWIGGYGEDDNGSLYENHHPDQHALLFHPTSSSIALSANDGGIQRTNNIYKEDMTWTSLNNGYVTSQFYTVNIPKWDDSEVIVGGLQDNGSYVTFSGNSATSWSMVLGGDGSYAATVPSGLFWYFSSQNGQTYRLTFEGDDSTFARVDPSPGPSSSFSKYLFINPFVLDPYNSNVMYMAGGNTIWRNNNLSQVPSGVNDPTTVNWEILNESKLDSGLITTLEISPRSTHVYYGTSTGELTRLDLEEEISKSHLIDFGTGHYVTCVGTSPDDDAEILVSVSNYGVPSLFHSLDSGKTITNVSGSLEEFPDGTGNGPSVRWVEIVPMENGGIRYFAGTSVGLYSTDELDGENTLWVREGIGTIGKSVIRMMDYRSLDGRLVVATHGNGVYRTNVEGFKSIEPAFLPPPEEFIVSNSFPNPFSEETHLEFEIPETTYMKVDIYDMRGNHVKNVLLGPQFPGKSVVTWDGTGQNGDFVKDGMYIFLVYYNGTVRISRVVYNR